MTTTGPLGDWFRHIGTKLSDTDYEAGIKALSWARDQFHVTTERPGVENADTSDVSAEPSDAEIQAAAEAIYGIAIGKIPPTSDLDSYWTRLARAALVAARGVAGR